MTDAPDTIQIGDPMPLLARVAPCAGTSISVEWAEGTRAGRRETVDLAPVIFGLNFYHPLRDDPALFRTAHAIRGGSAVGWGEGGEDSALDMAATTVERLAQEAMTPADFSAFLDRNKLTLDAAAAQLGISRRLVAYYASEKRIPRYIALACAYLEGRSSCGDRQTANGRPRRKSSASA